MGTVAWRRVGVAHCSGAPVLIQLDNPETIAEGGRFYAVGEGMSGTKLDDAMRAAAEAKAREAAAMNVVRD